MNLTPNPLSMNGEGAHFFSLSINGEGRGEVIELNPYFRNLSLMTTASLTFFDLTQVHPASKGFSGAVYDGQRYLYFIPMMSGHFYGQIARYDTHAPFEAVASWSVFDTATLNPASCGFVDGFLDGRYLYLVPYHNQQGHHGVVARYDTTAPLEGAASWSFHDLTTQQSGAKGYISGGFDGRYLYLAPYQESWSRHHGLFARLDTQGDFHGSGWSFFNSEHHWPESRGYHSAAVTPDRVFFIPYVREGRDYHGGVMVYQRGEAFTDPASWQKVDLTRFNSRAKGFIGGTLDGRYLYLAPYFDGVGRYGQMAQYDTTQPLTTAAAWQFFDTATVQVDSRGFFGALVHGDYCYWIPHCLAEGIYHGQITRYNRNLPFTDPAAWQTCNTTAHHAGSRGFIGGAVVGDDLYMAPFETEPGNHTGLVVRVNLRDESIWSGTAGI